MRIGLGKLVRIVTTVELMAKVNFDQLVLQKKKKKVRLRVGKSLLSQGVTLPAACLNLALLCFFQDFSVVLPNVFFGSRFPAF